MRIVIVDLLEAAPPFDVLPSAGTLIEQWLAPSMPDATFKTIPVARGAGLPMLADFDGLLVSGSEKGVYDHVPWMADLRTLLLQTQTARKPIYGICFGHQVMADTFGGKAEKVSDPVIGLCALKTDDTQIDGYLWHQDQVTQVPPKATVTMSASHCPVAALSYDFPAMSVQSHPEFTEQDFMDLIETATGSILTPDEAKAVAQGMTRPAAATELANEAADFFRRHCARDLSRTA